MNDPGSLPAVLAEIRERSDELGRFAEVSDIRAVADDVPRLLSALDAALACHERIPLYGNASTEGEPGACLHDPDSGLHFEDADGSGEWLCEGKPEGAVCSSCIDGEGGDRTEWPCPTYAAIERELTGKAADHG